MRRFRSVALLAIVAALAIQAAPLALDQGPSVVAATQPDGAPAAGNGPLALTSFVRVVDGRSIDAVLDGRRVAIAVQGFDAPQANTQCGKRATDLPKSLTRTARSRGGLRLVDDPSQTLDGRGRRIYQVEDASGRLLADELVKSGMVRTNGQGMSAGRLRQLDDEARQQGRRCQDGRSGALDPSQANPAMVAAGKPASEGDEALVKAAAAPAAPPRLNAVPSGFQDEVVADGMSEPRCRLEHLGGDQRGPGRRQLRLAVP